MDKYEIIVWVRGKDNGYVFRNQTDDEVVRVTKAAHTGEPFILNWGIDKFTVFARDSISHVQAINKGP